MYVGIQTLLVCMQSGGGLIIVSLTTIGHFRIMNISDEALVGLLYIHATLSDDWSGS